MLSFLKLGPLNFKLWPAVTSFFKCTISWVGYPWIRSRDFFISPTKKLSTQMDLKCFRRFGIHNSLICISWKKYKRDFTIKYVWQYIFERKGLLQKSYERKSELLLIKFKHRKLAYINTYFFIFFAVKLNQFIEKINVFKMKIV